MVRGAGQRSERGPRGAAARGADLDSEPADLRGLRRILWFFAQGDERAVGAGLKIQDAMLGGGDEPGSRAPGAGLYGVGGYHSFSRRVDLIGTL
ncbi:hypothetical protein M878_40260 [Streptomyces roseochromogenus subsp. oscitans DS 12.976]|uniref:Uncharacterized protein n=1 Tax=Streptomyces roseochromogenus subsp. oscitans DS 12.976 TaxID=1352936 RepID=V6JJG3_STRRC|nr:hypothetical protein M878_40260 [Streptomyces roseochromogenus subsp. oscitans DS 12.976]